MNDKINKIIRALGIKKKQIAICSAIALFLLCCVGISAKYIFHENDSPVEQAVELVLFIFGINLDFTPDEMLNKSGKE